MRRLAPGVLALCLALSACGGSEDEPAPTLAPLESSASPSPTGVAVPSEAAAATPEGAAEFVRFFYERLEEAYAQADPDLIAELSAPGCTACENFVASLDELRSSGGSVDPYSIEVLDVVTPGIEPTATETQASAFLKISEYIRRDAAGAVTVQEAAVDNAVQDLQLIRLDGQWRLKEITR